MVSAAISAGGAARRLLVRSQLRLVVQIAKSMLYSPNVELDDLVTVRTKREEKEQPEKPQKQKCATRGAYASSRAYAAPCLALTSSRCGAD